MRLGAVLKTAHRAAVEFRRAAAIWQEEGKRAEAKVAAWQALAREPASEAVFEFLRGVLVEDSDHAGLERLLGLRLGVVSEPRLCVPLWLERATTRLDHLGKGDAAIQDFKRILKVVPDHPAALRALATLAVTGKQLAAAIDFLKRLLVIESDGVGRRDLVLELARAHEAARERARALALMKEAVAARPDDEVPRQALVDLLLRSRNWGGARDALETWQETVAAPEKKAALWIRIGELWRDEERDRQAAATAFTKAATLDPLGAGVFRMAELQARFGDVAAQRAVLDDAIAAFRADLAREPLDTPRLRRLGELYAARVTGSDADELSALGIAVVGQVLALLGVVEKPLDGRLAALGGAAQRDIAPRAGFGAAFLTHLRAPGAGGFAAEIWAKIARTASEMFEAAHVKPPARERVAPGSEPRLAWIEAAAAAVGLPALELMLSKRQEPSDESVVAIDVGEPALVVGRAAFSGSAASRFAVGRALSLLRDRAVMFDSRTPAEIATLFAAASRAAGVAGPGEAPPEVAGYAKNMLRLMSRKDRKALELEASRFGFETIDGAAFQSGVLATADRLGLLMAGDVEVAIRVVCGGAPTPDDIAANRRALALLEFALGADYLVLRRDVNGAGG
jgi:tetratricopeptide (TPR) repeat protein